MDFRHLMTQALAPVEQSYDGRDAALYALNLGIGDDPLDEDELLYVFEGRRQQPVPSLCVTLGWPQLLHSDRAAGVDWTRIVHCEQRFTVHRPLPLQTVVRAEHYILYIDDKGVDCGALIGLDTEIRGVKTSHHLASLS